MKIPDRKDSSPISPIGPIIEPGAASVSQEKVEEIQPIREKAVSVDLSETSRDVRRAREALAGMSDVRTEKVAELKDAIEDGSYQVESRKIARKMVDEALRESIRLRQKKQP
ncbi:MAG: anti-sigma28 factor FlgM [candidate division BRC1 bacterium ADurb.BinA364]|nr:MAG: anti-sigma28 factor FlgM [candidate division BRC1 bacterium ADurb.BinA364]